MMEKLSKLRPVHSILWSALLAGATVSFAQNQNLRTATIKYISPEAIYVNAGRAEGIGRGDTLWVERDGSIRTWLLAAHVATHSAACRVVKGSSALAVGARVVYRSRAAAPAASRAKSAKTTASAEQKTRNSGKAKSAQRAERRRSRGRNRIRGSVALGGYWNTDLTGGGRSYWQSSVSGRLTVRNVGGSGLDFRYRQHSRRYSRTHAAGSGLPATEWAHRIYEFALVREDEARGRAFGIGRVLVPSIRGIGYLDGAHYRARVSELVSVGVVAGLEPVLDQAQLQTSWPKYGVFVEFHHSADNGDRWRSTLAFSGSMRKGLVDREFFYMQNQIALGSQFSLYQSLEMDVNRGWRRQAEGTALRFSNLFVNLNFHPWQSLSLYFSYDSRRQVHSYVTHDLPDSLFDDTTRQGVNGGVSIHLPRNLYFNLNGGLRFRQAGLMDNRYASVLVRARHLPAAGHTVTLRFSFFQTQFTRGYRPLLSYGLPVMRGLPVDLSVGGYLYETGGDVRGYYYSELRAMQYFSDLYLSASLRRYWDRGLQSMQVFFELGRNF